MRESKVFSEPDALIAWFVVLGALLVRTGLEAGPLSQWLHAAVAKAGLAWSCWRPATFVTPSRSCR